jgi:hypothetical protein
MTTGLNDCKTKRLTLTVYLSAFSNGTILVILSKTALKILTYKILEHE